MGLGLTTGRSLVNRTLTDTPTGATPATVVLTSREIEILRLTGEGLQNKEIAQRLRITTKTVEFHKTRLYPKIGVTSIAGAVRFAIREGYITA